MIEPTVGRQVWFWDENHAPQPQAATVVYVWNNSMVNLAVCSPNGLYYPKTSVLLWQGEGNRPQGEFCEWMPYQIKAARTRT